MNDRGDGCDSFGKGPMDNTEQEQADGVLGAKLSKCEHTR